MSERLRCRYCGWSTAAYRQPYRQESVRCGYRRLRAHVESEHPADAEYETAFDTWADGYLSERYRVEAA